MTATQDPEAQQTLLEMGDDDVVLYTRMSLLREEGIDRQRAETVPYLERQGFNVVDEFTDDGKSATKDNVKRDAFEGIIDLAKARRQLHGPTTFTKVGCWHSDRFARRVKDILRVEEAGILVYGKNSGHFDLSTPAGVATAVTVTAWAEYEGKQKALRQKASNKQRAEAGRPYWPQRPFGYNLDGTPHEIEAELLRAAYRDVLAGASLHGICREWSAKGITSTNGKPMGVTALRTLLVSVRNAGISTYHGVEVGKGNWTPLVAEDVVRSLRRFVADPRRRTRPDYEGRVNLLSGFAVCGGRCGQTVVAKSRPSGYRYYTCKRGCATAVQDWADDRASRILLNRLAGDPAIMERVQGTEDGDVEALRAELERLQRKGSEYREMLDTDELTREEFSELNTRNRESIKTTQESLTKIGLNESLRELVGVKNLREHWFDEMTMSKRTAVIRQFYSKIIMKPRGKGRGGNGRGSQMEVGDIEFWIAGYDEPVL